MAENDYTVIKPIQGLTNIAGANASKGNQDKKKQKKKQHSNRQTEDNVLEDELVKSVEDDVHRDIPSEDPDEHIIDFCA